MRILFVVDHAVGISGPHRGVVGSLNALTARDDTDVVLVTGKIDADEPYASASNLELRLGYDAHNPRRSVHNLRLIASAARGCDVVYVPSGLRSMLYAQVARWRKPLVVGPNVTPLPLPNRLHDSPGWVDLTVLSSNWIENSKNRRDHVMSQTGRLDLPYVHHSIDLSKFSPEHRDMEWKATLGISDTTPVILYVGRDNERRKGVRQLLDAFELSRMNRNCHLVLVGSMSDETMVRVSEMNDVTQMGFLVGTELGRVYASSDISVVPSSWESFGFTVLEGMASGLPVIASKGSGAIPEISIDGETGLLVDAVGSDGMHTSNAHEQLAEAIIRLIDDPDLRTTMGQRARKRAETAFSESRLGDDLMQVFQEAIGDE